MPEMRSSHTKGIQGEAIAEQHLNANGFQTIARRYRSPYGEIDLIMLDQHILVFIEVKYRTRTTLASAQLAVTPAKQRRIIQTALCFLNEHPEYAEHAMRFDIVSFSGEQCIEHLQNAFQGYGW